MNRTVAIVLTVATVIACGLPSIVLMCLGALALLGTQIPEVMAQNPGSTTEEVVLGAVMFLCVGAVLLIVPVLVGIFSFRLSKKEEGTSIDTIDYIPPAS